VSQFKRRTQIEKGISRQAVGGIFRLKREDIAGYKNYMCMIGCFVIRTPPNIIRAIKSEGMRGLH
jgi:hypothetical protein